MVFLMLNLELTINYIKVIWKSLIKLKKVERQGWIQAKVLKNMQEQRSNTVMSYEYSCITPNSKTVF